MNVILANDFRLVNTFYHKQEEYLAIFNDENSRTWIDYFMVRREKFDSCKKFKVIRQFKNLAHDLSFLYWLRDWSQKVKKIR